MYTIEQMMDDGSWQRSAQAHMWEKSDDAHSQCMDLQARYPDRIYAVTRVDGSQSSGEVKP